MSRLKRGIRKVQRRRNADGAGVLDTGRERVEEHVRTLTTVIPAHR